MPIIFRKATMADEPRCWQLILQARAFMAAAGRCQWDENYPTPSHIVNDIECGEAWVLCQDDVVMAYAAVIFTGEPAYDDIEGQWLTDDDYVVVHRLSVADEAKGKGLAKRYFREVAALAKSKGVSSFRVDTNFDNAPMLHILESLGFTYCGKIQYQQGERLAFEALASSVASRQ